MLKNKSSVLLLSAGAALVGLTGFGTQAARATLLVDSPFNYTVGTPLDGQNNSSDVGFGSGTYGGGEWLGYPGSPAAPSNINTIGQQLTYTDANGNSLAVSGNSASINVTTSRSGSTNEASYRDLAGELGNNGSASSSGYAVSPPQTLWISFIAQVPSSEATSGYNFGGVEFVDQANGNKQGLFMGQTGTTPVWGISNNNGSISAKVTDQPFTDKAFLVAEVILGGAPYNSISGGSAVINMWQNPLLGPSAPATPDATISDGVNFQFNQIAMNAGATISFGEIRVGTTWADVATPTPEPATLAIFGIAAGASLLLCRRKRLTHNRRIS
jgi:hypothetical protein